MKSLVACNPHIICKTLAVVKQAKVVVNTKRIVVTPYALGFKFCNTCDEWFYQPEIYCICCGRLLRKHARSKDGKQHFANDLQFKHLRKPLVTKYPALDESHFIEAQQFIIEKIMIAKTMRAEHSKQYHLKRKKEAGN